MIDPPIHPTQSLGRLVERALAQGVVSACTLTRGRVVISMGDASFSYGWDEGAQLLRLLLAGASVGEAAEAGAAEMRAEARSLEPVAVETHTGASAMRGAGLPRQGRLREDYLDTMLTFAARAGFIEGFDKDSANSKVILRTNATTTDLSYAETLEYLTSVVLDELSTLQPSPPPYRNGGQSISVLASE